MEQIIKKTIGLFTAIAICTSAMYLLTYWYTFGINPFEFIDISNIIAHSIVPLMLSVGAPLGVLLHYITRGHMSIPYNEHGEINPIFLSKYKRGSKKRVIILLIMTLVPCVLAQWIPYFWFVTPISFAVLISTYLSIHMNLGKRFITNPNIRSILLFVIVCLPLQGAAFGKQRAEIIKRGYKYLYIDRTSISEEVQKCGDDKIRYIGTMSDYFFFLLPSDESIYIASKEDIKPFILQRYDRKKNKK